MIPLAVSHGTSLPWHGKPSVRLSTPTTSPATSHAASSAMVLGPPLILVSMRSSNPHLHAPRSHLKHLLLYILLPPSMYSTVPVIPLMRPFGIQTSKRALPRLCTKSSVRRTLFLSFFQNFVEYLFAFIHFPQAMKPSPISTAPMTWLGVHDMLWQLTGIQKEYFKSQGGKPTVQPLLPTRRSLRKRKPVQALIQELSTREPSEVPDEPPRKKSKISGPEETGKGSETTACVVLDQSDVSTNNKAGPSELPHNKSTMTSSHETQGNVDVTPSPLTITSSLPPESHSPAKDDVAQPGTSRVRSKDALGKKVQANPAPSRSSVRRTRERSPSFSSGSSTAVSAVGGNSKRARSSSSASSTSTTVVAETGANGSSKGKGKAKAVVAPEEETEEEEETTGKRSTRTRRSSAREREAAGSKPSRKQGRTTSLRTPAEIDKLVIAEAPPRRVRSRSGVTSSRSRKSRKS